MLSATETVLPSTVKRLLVEQVNELGAGSFNESASYKFLY